MEDFIKRRITFLPYLCTMKKTERQREAIRFSLDYLNYLLQQEGVVERMIDIKLKSLEPKIEKMIEQKIKQHFNK